MRHFSVVLGGAVVAVCAACTITDSESHSAHVHFVLDAPLCSSTIPVSFFVDGALVASDTFRVHLSPSHTESRMFSVGVGPHVLGARSFGAFSYVWRDTTVNVSSGVIATDSLPFYCS